MNTHSDIVFSYWLIKKKKQKQKKKKTKQKQNKTKTKKKKTQKKKQQKNKQKKKKQQNNIQSGGRFEGTGYIIHIMFMSFVSMAKQSMSSFKYFM